MWKNSLLVCAGVLLAAATLLAEQKTLVLKDGRKITGEVTKTPTGYRVEMALGVLDFTQDQVARVEDAVAAAGDSYDALRRITNKSDPEAMYRLAELAVKKKMFREAKADLQAVLKLDKDHKKAQILLEYVEAQLAETIGPTTRIITPPPTEKLLIGEEDTYKIRLAELDLWYERARGAQGADTSVAVRFRNDVLNRFVESMRGIGDFKIPRFSERFLAMPQTTKVAYMLEYLGRDNTAIRDDILIRSDPEFMKEFRRTVWPIVSQTCAQIQCHGGEKVNGGVKLFPIAGRNVQADYTNFVVLSGKRTNRGRRVIDRSEHERSLLLQFGLPVEQATDRHPKEFKPIYTSKTAKDYRMVLDWLRKLRGPKHPDYRLEWKPPFGMVLDTSGRAVFPPEEPVKEPDKDKDKDKTKGPTKEDTPFST